MSVTGGRVLLLHMVFIAGLSHLAYALSRLCFTSPDMILLPQCLGPISLSHRRCNYPAVVSRAKRFRRDVLMVQYWSFVKRTSQTSSPTLAICCSHVIAANLWTTVCDIRFLDHSRHGTPKRPVARVSDTDVCTKLCILVML